MVSNQELKIQEFNDWFNDIISKAELADLRYNIKGMVVYRPWSTYSINKIFRMYEDVFDKTGHQQMIMPLLIPEENFFKEKEHVQGFTPEVFWVTEHGDEKFETKYALRPTSETAFYFMFSLWVDSHRDLPFKTYQRANIFRYDTKATKPFFRGREFYFFETHNIFETYEESYDQVLEDMQISEDILHVSLAIPFIFFNRPQWDKFPGALNTYGADALMPNGKTIQIVTTHTLGQNFTKPFDVKIKDINEEIVYPYGTCYGPGITRIYGALIGVHGDKIGLRLPFELAPTQIIITPLYFSGVDSNKIEEVCLDFATDLDKLGYRVKIDDQKEKRPKERFEYYEMKGVPVRIEVGPKDIDDGSVMIFRRDTNEKTRVCFADVFDEIKKISERFTDNLREQADEEFDDKLISLDNYDELKEELEKGKLVRVPFCSIDMDGKACADQLKSETNGGEVRGVRMDISEIPEDEEKCIVCNKKANVFVYVAKSY
ncbi:MAG: proline--tRNA ligase [Candidatus ainarchaeum sp.]|nr:proline--tRNA ligase [Candidatus ainarchaeum sp.]